MTPPLTPPNEAVSAVINAELAQLFPGSVIDPPPVNLSAHNKNANKSRTVTKKKSFHEIRISLLLMTGTTLSDCLFAYLSESRQCVLTVSIVRDL